MEKITPSDPRYAYLAGKRFNKRYTGRPDVICLPSSTSEVVTAVQDAVDRQLRVVARSGGHCLEGFVADPEVKVVVDLSIMKQVYHDPGRNAIAVEAGVTVGEMYRQLYLNWGVVVPAGEHPDIGMGGHVVGGAFGFLCREYGLAADYLEAVELVHVNASGKALSVIASKDKDDPHHELWWAHTGGGGGNFGIVTRYWFRSYGVNSSDPSKLLPKAPALVSTFRVSWSWEEISEITFNRLATNFGEWCSNNSASGSPANRLFSLLFLNHRNLQKIEVKGLVTGAGAKELIDEHLQALVRDTRLKADPQLDESEWLSFALNPFPELFQPGVESGKSKVKDALLRKAFKEAQLASAWRSLTSNDQVGGGLGMATYGGKVNVVESTVTASAQRNCIMDIACNTGWADTAGEKVSLAWVRNFYRDLFADTGGVPVPDLSNGGCMINHPDTDLADPEWNRSGVEWSQLYYQDNYPRLQQVKLNYDPLNIFHHPLSIKLPG